MRHTIVLLSTLALVFAALISSCGSGATPSPTTPVEAYPPPAQAVPEYPAPAQALPAYNPYPGPSEGAINFLDWAQADALIQTGDVAQVYQAQTLHVTLVLKDGSVAVTMEPAMDEVKKSVERCGEACKDTEIINQ